MLDVVEHNSQRISKALLPATVASGKKLKRSVAGERNATLQFFRVNSTMSSRSCLCIAGYDKDFLELGLGASYMHLRNVNQDQPFNFRKEFFLLRMAGSATDTNPSKGFIFRVGICAFF